MSAKNSTAQGGIYQIRCLVDGKIYIGSAVKIKRRWVWHRYNLNRGSHTNPILQNAWNKHGKGAFVFEILRTVEDREDLIRTEQEYLDRLRPWDRVIGYNVLPTAGSPRGRTHSAETRAKIGEAHRGMKRSPESIARMREAQRGKRLSPEHRAKVSLALSRRVVKAETRAKHGAHKKGVPRSLVARAKQATTLRKKAALTRLAENKHQLRLPFVGERSP